MVLVASMTLVPATLQAQAYTVQSGDTLMTIAADVYGQTSRWRELCNNNRIPDCDRIKIGEVLQLAPDARAETESTIKAAIEQNPEDPAPAPEAPSGATDVPTFTFDLSVGSGVTLLAPEGLSVNSIAQGAVMSGQPVAEAPSGGRTGGISFATGTETEDAASGKTIRVEIDATGNATFRVAYSTSDVGNSLWKTFTATPNSQTFSFIYAVPLKNNGNNDFVGIIPDTDGTGEALFVSSIRIIPIDK